MSLTLDLNSIILAFITGGGALLAKQLLAKLDKTSADVESIREHLAQIRVDVAAHGARLDAAETALSDRR